MITTVTTVTTITSSSIAYGLGIVATLLLIALLVVKELAGASVSAGGGGSGMTMSARLDRVLNVGILPLLIVFGAIVIDKVIAVLR